MLDLNRRMDISLPYSLAICHFNDFDPSAKLRATLYISKGRFTVAKARSSPFASIHFIPTRYHSASDTSANVKYGTHRESYAELDFSMGLAAVGRGVANGKRLSAWAENEAGNCGTGGEASCEKRR